MPPSDASSCPAYCPVEKGLSHRSSADSVGIQILFKARPYGAPNTQHTCLCAYTHACICVSVPWSIAWMSSCSNLEPRQHLSPRKRNMTAFGAHKPVSYDAIQSWSQPFNPHISGILSGDHGHWYTGCNPIKVSGNTLFFFHHRTLTQGGPYFTRIHWSSSKRDIHIGSTQTPQAC